MCDYYFIICQKSAGSPVSYNRNEDRENCSAKESNTTSTRTNETHVFSNSIFVNPVTYTGGEWVGFLKLIKVDCDLLFHTYSLLKAHRYI